MTNQFPATDEFADVSIDYNTTAAITVVMQDRTSPATGFELTPCQDLAIRLSRPSELECIARQ